ncbi:hypothetical protein [Streptomyces sp. bgisy060]|uniref:hypothetical protein n=1 Tax=Streptomyces sp. bgisy060 TaxID=3413775 RepID=UPI003EBAE7FB
MVKSIMDTPDVWIGLSDKELRRNRWWTAFLAVFLGGGTLAAGLTPPASERWWWVGVFGFVWVLAVFSMVNRGYGRTLLTAEGMKFHTFVSRRSIPWGEITRIEKREHHTRGGPFWDVRAVRVSGRSPTIPGVFTSRAFDAEFDQKLATIQERWARAAGA